MIKSRIDIDSNEKNKKKKSQILWFTKIPQNLKSFSFQPFRLVNNAEETNESNRQRMT